MKTKATINSILEAREKRASIRQELVQHGHASVSLSLNIPGYPKSNSAIAAFFILIRDQLFYYFKANQIGFSREQGNTFLDEAGHFCLLRLTENSFSIIEIKKKCEAFEESHRLGRLIDVDVADAEGHYISSNKMKKCFLCNEYSAIECMHAKRHSYEELRSFIQEKIQDYLNQKREEEVCRKLSSYALRAILYEISLTPKPGLVDTLDSGIHKDMDYFSFIDSSAEIAPFFTDLATAGYQFKGDYAEALPLIRSIGLKMEAQMFRTTNKVNTQKGIIFLMGIALFVSAHLLSKSKSFKLDDFQKLSKLISKNILSEFMQNHKDSTHGIKCASQYGFETGGGARFEVFNGFETVINYGLPQLHKMGEIGDISKNRHDALTAALLSLMAHNNDTNILYRSDVETLQKLQQLAMNTFVHLNKKEFNNYYEVLNKFCLEKKISPGGAADLLAVSTFIYFIKNKFNDVS